MILLQDVGSCVFANIPEDDVEAVAQGLELVLPPGCSTHRVTSVLGYLRNQTLTPDLMLGDCTNEITFMGLEHLFDIDTEGRLVPSMDRFDVHTMLASQPIWLQHRADKHMRRGFWKNPFLAAQAQGHLLTPETLLLWPSVLQHDERSSGHCAILEPPNTPLHNQPDFPIQWQAFHTRVRSLPQGLPWASPGIPGVAIAGGALEAWLLGQTPGDIDIFLIWPGQPQDQEEQGRFIMHRIVHQTIEAIASHHRGGIYLVNKGNIIDIVTYNNNIKYQIIMIVYSSVAQLISGFDIDSCRLALTRDGRLWAHNTAMRAWKQGWNLFDAKTLSRSALLRYAKKRTRGFGILFVGISQKYLDVLWTKATTFADAFCRGMCSLPRNLPICIEALLLHAAVGPDLMQRVMKLTSDYDYSESTFEYFRMAKSTCILEGAAVIPFKDESGFYSHGIMVHMSQRSNSIHLAIQFNINQDVHGNFTGAFNPVTSDIYQRLPVGLFDD